MVDSKVSVAVVVIVAILMVSGRRRRHSQFLVCSRFVSPEANLQAAMAAAVDLGDATICYERITAVVINE